MMQAHKVVIALLLWALFCAHAATAEIWVPRYTIVPVKMVDGLASDKNKTGDMFETRAFGNNTGGFPPETKFVGVVTEIAPASGEQPGVIDVKFVEAVLPDNTRLSINGSLTDLSDDAVQTDPVTGNLVGTQKTKTSAKAFSVVGGGIGVAVSNRKTKGFFTGAAIGALVGSQVKRTKGKQVTVPIGTEVGVMLRDPVRLPDPKPPAPPKVSRLEAGGTALMYTQAAPYMDHGILMVPLRSVLLAAGVPFSYDSKTKVVTISSPFGMIKHWSGTNRANIAGQGVFLETPSDVMSGILYVPEELMELATGKMISWDPTGRTLTLT
jgi:hypothetical protein